MHPHAPDTPRRLNPAQLDDLLAAQRRGRWPPPRRIDPAPAEVTLDDEQLERLVAAARGIDAEGDNVGSEARNARPLHRCVADYLAQALGDIQPGVRVGLALVGGIVAVVGALHWLLS